MAIDFNPSRFQRDEISGAVTAAIDRSLVALDTATSPRRDYLGASQIGKACLRQIQYEVVHAETEKPISAQTLRIFERGHWGEAYTATLMQCAGFEMVTQRKQGGQIGFAALGGRFKGHIDGVAVGGPVDMAYPALWEAKTVGAKSWRDIEKRGVAAARPVYAAQIALYQAYLDLTENPALFTALNADTMEIHAELVPFDAGLAQRTSDRAVQIIQAIDAGELLPRVATSPDYHECRWCPFAKRCWA